jgi:hypothetical protein
MSGFLRRLTASVAGRDSRVHPMVGGLFSREPSAVLPEQSLSEGAASADSLITRREAAPERQNDATKELPEAHTPQPLVSVWLSGASRTDSHRTQVGFARPAREPDGAGTSKRFAAESEGRAVAHRASPTTQAFSAAGDDQLETTLATVQPVSVRRQAPNTSAQNAHAQATNEVQIHIGRIEVTAVPSAMPRAAPPAPRSAMSLDDYLARRDGRRP